MDSIQKLGVVIKQWEAFCCEKHDIECNQKYSKNLPYSFHLKCVDSQVGANRKLVELDTTEKFIVSMAAWGHDLIEDARMTYNDIVTELIALFVRLDITDVMGYKVDTISERIADIIYKLTDEKGKSRSERKSPKYYKELKEDRLAVYVKVGGDIAANKMFSKLMGSTMYRKYNREFPKLREELCTEEFEKLFDYIEKI